jgi:hypothetical protein
MGADPVSKLCPFFLLFFQYEMMDKVQKLNNPKRKISVSGGEA